MEAESKTKIYCRDGRAPIPENETRSRIMSAIGAKDTSPEIALRKALSLNGIRGYRLHQRNVVGRPDICFCAKKVAIFVHGCYWHGCPYCKLRKPKTHKKFWNEKFEKNKARDKNKARMLRESGWEVITLWECQIKKNIMSCFYKVLRSLINE